MLGPDRSAAPPKSAVLEKTGRPAVARPLPDLPRPAGRFRRAWKWLTDLSAQSFAHQPPHPQQKEEP
ncbi:hypothetical protein acdb102_24800 [Acidothermaceae bacterium B102]|nr:hypothetical protein acdb102_24800 [Acidothermaceae bacterium B102]